MKKKFISKKMKLFMSVILMASLVCYALGFIILINNDYDFSKITTRLNSLNLSTVKFYLDKNFFNFSLNQSMYSTEYTVDDNINSIYFNVASQDVKITSYNDDVIQININGPKFQNNIEMVSSQTDDALTFSTSNNMNSNLDITINLPAKLISDYNININTSTGDIYVSNISTDSLNFFTSSGDIYLLNLYVNYLNLKNFSGDINIINSVSSIESKLSLNSGDLYCNGDLGLVSADNISGDISLNFNNLSKNISLTCISGDISLTLPYNSDYKTNYSSRSGNLLCSQSLLTNGDESHNINITTGDGDTFINRN